MGSVDNAVQAIYDRDGAVVPSVVVTEAKKKKSPLHACFEWNDSAAGEEYRLIQARQLIRRVRIVFESEPARLVHVPISVERPGESGEGYYKPLRVIVSQPSEYTLALSEALTRWRSAKAAVQELEQAAAGMDDEGNLAALALALKSMEVAEGALAQMH